MSDFFDKRNYWIGVAIRPLGLNVPFYGDNWAMSELSDYNEKLADWNDEVNQLTSELMGNGPTYWSEIPHYESLAELQLQDSWPIPEFTSHKVHAGGSWWEIVVMFDPHNFRRVTDHPEISQVLAHEFEGFDHV